MSTPGESSSHHSLASHYPGFDRFSYRILQKQFDEEGNGNVVNSIHPGTKHSKIQQQSVIPLEVSMTMSSLPIYNYLFLRTEPTPLPTVPVCQTRATRAKCCGTTSPPSSGRKPSADQVSSTVQHSKLTNQPLGVRTRIFCDPCS